MNSASASAVMAVLLPEATAARSDIDAIREALAKQTLGEVPLVGPGELDAEDESEFVWFPGSEPTLQAAEMLCAFLRCHPDYAFVRGRQPGPGEFRPREFRKRPAQAGLGLLVRRAGLRGVLPDSLDELARALGRAVSEGRKGAFLAARTEPGAVETPALDPAEVLAGLDLEAEPFESRGGRPRHEIRRTVPLANGGAPSPDPKEILFLVPHFAIGGSDKFTLDLAERLASDHGFRPSFVATLSKEDAWRSRFEEINERCFLLQEFLTRPHFPNFIADQIRRRRIGTVVVTHSALGYQCLPWLRAEFPEVRFVDYLHIDEEWRDGGYPGLSLDYGRCLDRSFVSSQHLAEWMTTRGADPGRIEVVTTNIDPMQWDPAGIDRDAVRSQYGVPEAVPLILSAGRLEAQKQPELLARVAEELAARRVPFHCLVAGDGALRPTLEREASLHLLGNVDPPELRRLMAAADVFFIPSDNEGIALANYEAMAMECAIVGSEVGGQAELVTSDCGILVPFDQRGEVAPYVDALQSILEDPAECAALGRAARQRVCDHFRLDQMAASIASSLQDLPIATSIKVGAEVLQDHMDLIIEEFRVDQELYHHEPQSEQGLRLASDLARLYAEERGICRELFGYRS